MDNQHRRISGYRELSKSEIKAMNRIKRLGRRCQEEIDLLRANPDIDTRWLHIGQTDLQKGLMALTRSIARPDFF